MHPLKEFEKFNVTDTIVFFGSARIKRPSETLSRIKKIKAHRAVSPAEEKTFNNQLLLSQYYTEASQLAYRLTKWSKALPKHSKRFLICTGGGPGIMEAGNRGASLAKGLSIGLNISLPFEQTPNHYITPELCFDFNYFFMRKYWLMHLAKALVIFPGGFGTLDEVFELLTLIQTGKFDRPVPLVIYGTEFWDKIIDFNALADWGTIDKSDLDYVHFSDSVEGSFNFLTETLTELHLKTH